MLSGGRCLTEENKVGQGEERMTAGVGFTITQGAEQKPL